MKRQPAFTSTLIVAVLGMLLGVSPAMGSVAQYSTAAASNPNAIVQYSFDGDTNVERRQDSTGNNNLDEFVGSSGSAAAIQYGVAGFDWSSEAFTPQRASTHTSAGFITHDPINMPNTASFDAIVRPRALNGGGYVLGGRSTNNTRNYWLIQYNGDLLSVHGDDFFSHFGDAVPNYTNDDWYYVAATVSYDGSETTVNTWSANLSSVERTLTQMTTNKVVSGTFVNNLALGVGIANNIGIAQEGFSGDIDEVSLYSGLLSEDDFQAHLDQIYIPEPATLLVWSLLATFGITFGWRRRKR